MKEIVSHIEKFQQANPTSTLLFDIVTYDKVHTIYSNLYNIDRLEVALLEEGKISEFEIAKFIYSLKDIVLPIVWNK